jgi:2-C-methyl-D-erythritol 4-phosphate cytidylyltransferase
MHLALVCVGGGRGERFGGDKLAVDVAGRTVLERSLAALREAFPEAPLVAVVPSDRMCFWTARLGAEFPDFRCIAGGERRQDSVRRGVEAVTAEVVVIHDAARPLVDPADVRRAVATLGRADGSILVGRIADTVKRVDERGRVVETVDRAPLRVAQTPQVFRVVALESAWRTCDLGREWTDEASLLEACGLEVMTVEADRPNPKITTQADLEIVRRLTGAPA